MKIEPLIINVTSAGSPARAESMFLVILDASRTIQAAFVVPQPLCDLEIPALSPQSITWDNLMKITGSITDATAFGSSARAENVFGGYFGRFLANTGRSCGRGVIL